MEVLSCVGVASGVKPFETFGKDSGIAQEGGNTGRRADWPCHTKIADTEILLRPSVQLPAGIHGCAPYKGFGRHGKEKPARRNTAQNGLSNPPLDFFVCMTYK